MTTGMDCNTGKPLTGDAHIAQSIGDILTTPFGTRIGLEDYGSALFELADLPLNDSTRQLMIAASVMAIQRWETRIKPKKVTLSGDFNSGQAVADIAYVHAGATASNVLSSLSIPLASATAAA